MSYKRYVQFQTSLFSCAKPEATFTHCDQSGRFRILVHVIHDFVSWCMLYTISCLGACYACTIVRGNEMHS